MSYHEQAQKMNDRLKYIFNNNECVDMNKYKKEIINIIIWFGQVAKYRCRSNVAYDNFSNMVFKDIATLTRFAKEESDFKFLQVENVE